MKAKILKEIKNNLDINEEIGEEIIFFTSVVVAYKRDKIIPTFTIMANDKLTKKMKESGLNYKRLNETQKHFIDAVVEIIRQCKDQIDDPAFM